jgi:peptide/nickel transport system substrate-binding protein
MVARHRLLIALAALALVAAACNGEPVGDLEDPGDDIAETDPGDDVAEDAEDVDDAEDGEDVEHPENSITVVGGQADELDPSFYRTAASSAVLAVICESLYDYDMDAELIPRLASELPEPDGDGTTVTIPLRDDAVFNDGTQLDAEAVKTSLDRHREHEDSNRSGEVEIIESVDVVDEHTIQLSLSEPFGPLGATLAGPAGRIMSAAQLEELGDEFGDDPVCVGPFQFGDRPNQDTIVVERSEEYYGADEVSLDQITFQAIDDNAVAVNNLRSGEVHMTPVDPNNVGQVEEAGNLQVLTREGYGYRGLTVNLGLVDGMDEPVGEVEGPLAQDPRIREAFELALDKETIMEVVFDGMHAVACSAVAPHGPFGDANPECPGRDLERAQQLIEESDYDAPVEVDLMVTTGRDNQRVGELIQAMTEEAGFAVNLRVLEATTAIDQMVEGEYEMIYLGFGSGPDPDTAVYRMNHSEGGSNDSGVGAGPLDGQIDESLDRARTTFDQDERVELLREPLELILERRAIIYLFHPSHIVGTSGDLEGVELTPGGAPDFRKVRFTG